MTPPITKCITVRATMVPPAPSRSLPCLRVLPPDSPAAGATSLTRLLPPARLPSRPDAAAVAPVDDECLAVSTCSLDL